jgi:hypothetical protein
MSEFAAALEEIGDDDVFLTMTPVNPDFTGKPAVTITVSTPKYKISFPVPSEQDRLKELWGLLAHYLGGGRRVLLGWDIKGLFSYVHAKAGKPWIPDSSVFDLKVLERYVGLDRQAPADFFEARARLGELISHPSWQELKRVYRRIYTPLVCRIIPEIEAVGIVHRKLKKRLHANYDVTGQANGRMACSKGYSAGYNPHSIMPDDAPELRPPFFDHVFLYLDYNHMEVNTLQWLSQDSALGEILASGEDVYCGIWKRLGGGECTETLRKVCKGVFLPVAYGQGTGSLATVNNVSINAARGLRTRINETFPMSMNWLARQQELASPSATDAFGRCREFGEDENYKVRNFVVQSPAALYCLDKLVKLWHDIRDVARVVAHIHDGYVLSAPRLMAKQVRDMAVKSLEAENDLFPGLNLKVTCKVGATFAELK